MARLSAVFGSATHGSPWALLRRCTLVLGTVLWLGACTQNTVPDGPPSVQGPGPEAPGTPAADAGPQPQFDRFGRPISAETIRVGLLLPLTGRGSDVGAAMLNAAEMALFEAGVANFELLPRDTGGTPQGAASAAQSALADGARLIIGPLFGDNVPAVRQVAEGADVNVVAFTNTRTMAGGNVLIMGILPSAEVERVVAYSVNQGLSRFAVLAPDTAYGRTVVEALQQSTRDRGAELSRVGFYDPDAQDYSDAVRAMATDGTPYDAIMLPEGGLRLRALAPLLPYYGIDQVRVLGTGQWDEPGLGREPALVGGWYAAPQANLRTGFEQRYRRLFGSTPPRLATLAYDAVAMAAVLSRSSGGATYDWAALTDPSGFAGLDGLFRFRPNGEIERGLAVMEITPEGTAVRDPAPTSFTAPAF